MWNVRGGAPLRGTTLVEVVVALLVLTTGLLALAGVAAAVTRMVEQGTRATAAAALLGEKVELLGGAACGAAGGPGRESRPPFRVRWVVSVEGSGRRVRVWVSSPGLQPEEVLAERFVACES